MGNIAHRIGNVAHHLPRLRKTSSGEREDVFSNASSSRIRGAASAVTRATSPAPRCSARSSVLGREVLVELADVAHDARTRRSALERKVESENEPGSEATNGL